MDTQKNRIKNIKSKLHVNLELLQSEMFSLPLNRRTLHKNAAILENNLVLALHEESFDDYVFLQFRLMVQNLRELSLSVNNKFHQQNYLGLI